MSLFSFVNYMSNLALTNWTGSMTAMVASYVLAVAEASSWVGVPLPFFPITAALDLYTSNLMFYGHLGALPAMEMALLVPVSVWVEFITWYLLMLVAFPIIASVSHHYKLAGDTCIRVTTRYTECLPVNQPIEDAREALSELIDLYKEIESELDKIKPWWLKYLKIMLRMLCDFAGIPLPESIEQIIVEGVEKSIASKIAGKIAGFYFLMNHMKRCWMDDWNSAYLGAATVCFSFLSGPHMIDTDPCLTWNPLLAGWHQPSGFRELLSYLGFWVVSRYILPFMRGLTAFAVRMIEQSLMRVILLASFMGVMILASCVSWAAFEK